MSDTLVMLAHAPTDAVNNGFLPASHRLGRRVVIVTDQTAAHHRYFSQPDLPAYPVDIVECDVFNPIAVLDALAQMAPLAGVFSNSDHLQTVTALAAAYFGLPGKDWRVCYQAKNKAAMRAKLQTSEQGGCWFAELQNMHSVNALPADVPYPCVVKPREGVASLHVTKVENLTQLNEYCDGFWRQNPGQPLLLEAFLEGSVHTLETLGDQHDLIALGGFDVTLSAPPHFVELDARWRPFRSDDSLTHQMLEQVRAFGVQFGACHSEFVLTTTGPQLIEINYRSIGDGREFLLDRMLDGRWFDSVLRLHLGQPLPALEPPGQAAHVRYLMAPGSGEIVRAGSARQESCGDGGLEFKPLRKVGDEVQITHSNKDYLGILRLFASDRAMVDRALDDWSRALTEEWELRS
ncbi:ATP-grasp domain-containing protein [Marinobacter sp.]|uniref:ATP-grasp domain-containing protein n=1 Tax=Marinobacter sp. TaxID=50741 RepID=UPI001B53A2EC|nr:ATP-grasp domain-containing protein [Marinobacter sp.]MBQ0834719.1 ATP-grasp domain-containing protein [Marinobacter sp.]